MVNKENYETKNDGEAKQRERAIACELGFELSRKSEEIKIKMQLRTTQIIIRKINIRTIKAAEI